MPDSFKDEANLNIPSLSSCWHGFRVLPENRAAYRAARLLCRAVIAERKLSATPLILHGPPGAGKSWLVAAMVKHLADSADVIATAQVVSAGELVRSPEEGFAASELFDCDLLALEDIHHISDASAEAVRELIDRRVTRQRPTVITANRGPAKLAHLPRRLTSRLAAGLVIQLKPLGARSRRAIIEDAAAAKGVGLTSDALEWLAGQVSSVRAALGVLQNLAQAARTFPGPLGKLDVERILAESGQPTSAGCNVFAIVKSVAAAFGVSEKELLGSSRLRGILRPRQVAMYLVRDLTKLSLPRIGAAFARDHTTVLHACRKVEEELVADAELAKLVSELRASFS